MLRWKIWLVLLLSSLVPLIGLAQNQGEVDLSRPLALQECIQIAVENSTNMRNARIDLAVQELRVKDARARYYPELFLNGRYNFSDQVDFGFERENYDADITGQYTLWDNGQREVNFAQAKESRSTTASRNEQIRQNLIFQVTQAYYDVLQTQELVKVSEELLARSHENTERVRAFVEAGIQIQADIATAQVREANDELSLLNNRNDLEIAMATLPRLIGLNPGTLITVAEDSDYQRYRETGQIETVDMLVEEAIQRAFESRPKFQEIQAQIKQQEWDLTLAKLDRWPRLNAEFDYNVNLDDYLRERENFGEFRQWNVTTTLNFTIFDGGTSSRRVKEVELRLEETREDASDLERSIALEVRQAYLNLKRAERAVEISNTQVRNAQLSLEVIQGRFEQELAILLELLNAQTEFAQALTNQVRAFYDYKIVQTALLRAMGVLQ